MRAPITLDLHLPNFNYPGVGPDALFDKVAEIAQGAEAAGFTSITVMDHLHQIPPVGPRTNFMLEGPTVLAGIAARTAAINLGLLVGGVTYRNPALMAKITTTLDIISRGRAFLGIGAAWFEEEHDAYGFRFPPLKERFEHLEDTLQIARLMFTREEPSFEGRHHRISNVLNNPRPLRGDIPIVIGGSGEKKTLRFVAKYADGCNVFGDVENAGRLIGILREHCEREGRDPAEITKTRNGALLIAPTHEAAQAKLDFLRQAGIPEERIASTFMVGDPDSVAEQAQAFLDAGLDGLTFMIPDAHDPETIALAGKTLAPVLAP